ncbi:TPA: di-trans,poly-cis-decaprenylcistransferase [Candidatus Collierbacteria bacterium]|uniref:Isoprenyl transferase n=1 Tax=Candidatus Collierbacteria bacterium GW2011_GWA2_42_17 TaxID=1618378 RepID=A0A0G0Z402_9BACT|nr:MAG: Isoprenyl transferase [Candidatus Collierbacteria bacterium GW2011_GWB2_42_12]KKS43467.1 MAG: Isoprenyl transferase [Candidatus Collierbacteria bacterium GW2011_GWA2_42_17]KKS62485.1 MAG: Isoprenyl transferase [Candidatus Collierbacteria bacterium GW2011_GWE2_42_48]KKS62767.1 MAG: Isoprenyl transferase [Candidatus Collierbacteria bacterium GW2011_GWD2_42_50]KKS64733.1 MAG: Isoprenyl transferase [Candidatus Collierbacteria bacterium GW2011_GWF2_42_51]KKS67581.1 MAG: Isoprenyl transferas
MEPPLKHVAIIMDGNRRWAKAQGLDPVKGHEQAAKKAIEPLIEKCVELGIPYVTFWAFSTENWKRDEVELKGLFEVFRFALGSLALRFIQRGARLRILGDISRFPKDIAQKSLEMITKSSKNHKITVTFALNYGGRDEILRAVKKIVANNTPVEKIDESLFSSYLDTAGIPDPDLIIRTGGEKRLSGYLPWQSVYSELLFTPTLFPDFTPDQLILAIDDFLKRDRRFGGDSPKKVK